MLLKSPLNLRVVCSVDDDVDYLFDNTHASFQYDLGSVEKSWTREVRIPITFRTIFTLSGNGIVKNYCIK